MTIDTYYLLQIYLNVHGMYLIISSMHTKKLEALLMLAGRLYLSFLFTLNGHNFKKKIKKKKKRYMLIMHLL